LSAGRIAIFFGTGFLLLTHPREEMLATRSKTPEATLIQPGQTDAATETTETTGGATHH
jgi:hypothetical protein